MEEISLRQVELGLVQLKGEVNLLRELQSSNHRQNRGSIHDLRGAIDQVGGEVSEVMKDVTRIKVDLAGLIGKVIGAGTAVGTLVAVVVEAIRHVWK